MIFDLGKYSVSQKNIPVSARCPSCNEMSRFEDLGVPDIYQDLNEYDMNNYIHLVFGQRRCPNHSCYAHIFFVLKDKGGQNCEDTIDILAIYPSPKEIQIDTLGLPEKVKSSFNQAVSCFSICCYDASGMMLRKTLEAICHDKGAEGANLHRRIENLREKVILPKELLEGFNELKLLGNDAAHIESKDFENIGKEEIEVGIECTKEILKALYQYDRLLDKLRAFKKDTAV